jgi:hypothetical protein
MRRLVAAAVAAAALAVPAGASAGTTAELDAEAIRAACPTPVLSCVDDAINAACPSTVVDCVMGPANAVIDQGQALATAYARYVQDFVWGSLYGPEDPHRLCRLIWGQPCSTG